jgi:uncharacterized protein
MFKRTVKLSKSNSFFLFGARGTGKSTLIQSYFSQKKSVYLDLLEIVAEQIIRKLRPFKNFLSVAAQMNGKILNINKIATDVGVDHTTVQNYFEILEDTLVGFRLQPYHKSVRKRQRSADKFYYFDVGVTRALNKLIDVPLTENSFEYGDAFEHFVILEIKRLCDYYQPDWQLSYLMTKDDAEIDLIIERPKQATIAIEIKSTQDVNKLSLSKIGSFSKLVADMPNTLGYVFSQDKLEKSKDGIIYLPWQKGLERIGLLK